LDSAATKQEILKSGVTVASLFFGEVFGKQAQKALTVFVALRYFSAIFNFHLLTVIQSALGCVDHPLDGILFTNKSSYHIMDHIG
jgi:hypothetical protein